MNMEKLKSRYPELIANMEERCYSHDYIGRLEREIQTILANASSNNWQSYGDIYRGYVANGMSKGALHHRLARLGIIERFDERGEFPDGRTRQKIVMHGKEQYLSEEFKRIVEKYRDYESLRGRKKASTISVDASTAANFLYALHCAGIDSVAEITQQSVISAFTNEDGTLRWSQSCKNRLAVVFGASMSTSPELFTRVIAYLPALRGTRKNIQYLTDEEFGKVKRVLTDRSSGLSLRDIAIGTLALSYGLRKCDIAALKLDEVDLIGEKIRIKQQKTAVPLELPLTAAAGNAIYDYATQERPESDCEYVFLRELRPFGRLCSSSLSNTAIEIMKAAGIRQNVGDRKGFHIFRHRLATSLLGNGVAQPVISKIAGHKSPESLETYLSADFKHLKECSIGLERFPLREDVFSNA